MQWVSLGAGIIVEILQNTSVKHCYGLVSDTLNLSSWSRLPDEMTDQTRVDSQAKLNPDAQPIDAHHRPREPSVSLLLCSDLAR